MDNDNQVNFAHFHDFAGMSTFHKLQNMDKLSIAKLLITIVWILDSGATSHMVSKLELFDLFKQVCQRTPISLPDSTVKFVENAGTVKLSDTLVLQECLHVPTLSTI